MGRKAYRVSPRQPGRRNIEPDILRPGFFYSADVTLPFYDVLKQEAEMIAYYPSNSCNRLFDATGEVNQETIKQSNDRLIKVNHSKEWGAKPLV